jgi:hypothetical protein
MACIGGQLAGRKICMIEAVRAISTISVLQGCSYWLVEGFLLAGLGSQMDVGELALRLS